MIHPTALRILLPVLIALLSLFTLPNQAKASTQAGEMIVVKLDGNTLKARIMFMEYFSGPREFYIGQKWSSKGMNGGWLPKDYGVSYIDGRYVKQDVLRKAMVPGRRYYQYGSRHTIEFIHVYTHDLPTQGHVLRMDNNTLVLRRFMLRRADTGSAVFRNFEVTIDKDAIYMVNGETSSKGKVFSDPEKHLIRAFPARELTLSVFRNESLASNQDFGENHTGGQAGQVVKTGKVDHKGKAMMGVYLKTLQDGKWVEKGMPVDRKGYTILDGRYVPWREQAVNNSTWAAGAVYRKWTKAKYILLRSKALGAYDGEITKVSSGSVTIQLLDGKERTVKFDKDARILLDALNSNASEALKVGRQITVFEKRLQVIEAITGAGRQPQLPQQKTQEKGKTIPFAIIEYRVDNHRRLISDGYYPLFDRDKEPWEHIKTKEAGVRFPMSMVKDGADAMRAVTKEDGPFYWTIPQTPARP